METKRLTLLILSLSLVLSSGCSTVQNAMQRNKPTASLVDVKFDQVKLDSATLLFDVEIENHYPVPLPLTNFEYGLSSGQANFLSGSAASQATIPAKSSKVISLPATVNYLEMLKALSGIKQGAKIPYKADLTLSVDTPALGLLSLPLKKQGELELPTVSDSTISDIWNIVKPK